MNKVDVTITAKWDKSAIDQFLKAVVKAGLQEMAISNKVTVLNGTKQSQNLINLDEEFNGSFQVKLSQYQISAFVVDSWNEIPDNSKVSISISGQKIVSINPIKETVKKPVYKVTKPAGYQNGFWISPETQRIIDACNKILDQFSYFHLLFKGASGYGKTSIAEHLSQQSDKELVTVDCATIQDSSDWFFKMGAKDGSTFAQETEFVEALVKGGCNILFDEANRIDTWISNTLLPILDHRKAITINNKNYKAGKGIGFIFTTNDGWEYHGTKPLDKALKGRINGVLKVDALPREIEEFLLVDRYKIGAKDAKIIVQSMNDIRKQLETGLTNASTRTSLNIALWLAGGLELDEAFQVGMINDANPDEAKIIQDALKAAKAEYF